MHGREGHSGPRSGFLYYIFLQSPIDKAPPIHQLGRTEQICGIQHWEPSSVYSIENWISISYFKFLST
jgi:hypothetical protein